MLEGIAIYWIVRITHFIFVDDVLLFGKRSMEEWKGYKDILDLFSGASSMAISGSTIFVFGSWFDKGCFSSDKVFVPLSSLGPW